MQTNQRGQSPYPPPIQSPGPSPYPGGSQQPQQAPTGIVNQGPAASQPPQGPLPPQQQYSPFPQRYPTPPSSTGPPQSLGGPHNHRAAPYPPHQVNFIVASWSICIMYKRWKHYDESVIFKSKSFLWWYVESLVHWRHAKGFSVSSVCFLILSYIWWMRYLSLKLLANSELLKLWVKFAEATTILCFYFHFSTDFMNEKEMEKFVLLLCIRMHRIRWFSWLLLLLERPRWYVRIFWAKNVVHKGLFGLCYEFVGN